MNESNENPITYAIYVRKSSESEDKQVQSLVRQISELKELVDRDGLVIHPRIFEEQQSAFRLGRPVFQELVDLTIKGEVNAWLCWHTNRLSRNPMDGGLVIHLIDQGYLNHIRTKDRIYINSPQDKLMLQIEFGFSKNDSEEKSSIVKSGIRRRHERGYPSGYPPVGFRPAGGYTGSSGRSIWEADTEQLSLLRKVFLRFLKGEDSTLTICEFAAAIGLRSEPRRRIGGRSPSPSAIHRILTNPIYSGYFRGRDGKRYDLAEELPRLITEDELEIIRTILDGRNPGKVRERRVSAFKGLVLNPDGRALTPEHKFQLVCDCGFKFCYLQRDRCPRCNARIDSLRKPKWRHYVYYFGRTASRFRGRRVYSIEERKLKSLVIEHLNERLVLPRNIRDWSLRYLHELQDESLRNRRREQQEYEKFKREIEGKRRRLREVYMDGLISKSEFENEVKTLNVLGNLQRAPDFTLAVNWKDEGERMLDAADEAVLLLRRGNASEIQQGLRALGIQFIWDGEKLEFKYSGLLRRINGLLKQAAASKSEVAESKTDGVNRLDP